MADKILIIYLKHRVNSRQTFPFLNSVRGTLGSFILLFTNVGTVIGFIVGAFWHFTYVPHIGLAFSLCFFASLFIIHDSPQYYLSKNQVDKAEKASDFYHGGLKVNTEDIIEKQSEIKTSKDPESSNKKITIEDFRKI